MRRLLKEILDTRHLFGNRHERRAPQGGTETALFEEFKAMSINDVRRRADAFVEARISLHKWQRERVDELESGPRAETGINPEAFHDIDREAPWRELEAQLRENKLFAVSDLPRDAQLLWARRTHALSNTFRAPTTRTIGPQPPKPLRE